MEKIIIHLHTIYQIKSGSKSVRVVEFDYESGITVQKILDQLAIKVEPANTLFVVNGRVRELGYTLEPGDEVHFIPAISGG